MRLKIIRIIIVFLFIVLSGGLVFLQVIQGQLYYHLSANNRIRIVSIESLRGRILDRQGVVLADTRISFDVIVVPQEVQDEQALFSFLSKTLNVKAENLLKTFRARTVARFVPVTIAEDIDRDHAIVLEENKFRFPGLIVRLGSRRNYPFEEIGAHVLGYVGEISPARKLRFKEYGYAVPRLTGYSGIEEYYDSFLRGEDGGLQVEVNHRGEQTRLLGMRTPVSGQDVALTIDARIQRIASEILADAAGTIVVTNLETGEVLGMVSSPSFDPNVFVDAGRSRERTKLLTDANAPMINRAISGQYPPGSIFKIPLAVLGLHSRKATTVTSFICKGFYQLGRRQFRCTHAHGAQNFVEAIAHSCNVYFYNLGLVVGPEAMRDIAHLFGLGALTGIDLPFEERGLIPDPERFFRRAKRQWSRGDTLNFSIGQGDVLATPLQLVNMIATVVRDGQQVPLRMLKSVGGVEYQRDLWPSGTGVFKQHIDPVKSGMRAAVEDYTGTARSVRIPGMMIVGKTGTAQTSGDQDSHAWFVGACPETKTKIAFCVFLEHGGSSYNACMLARKLLLAMQEENIL